MTTDTLRPLVDTLKALAHPVRLRILALLRDGELCVCDLVEILQAPQPTVSRHLSYLRRAGLVTARQERSWNFYELSPAKRAFHKKLLECLSVCFRDVPELDADGQRARSIRVIGGCCR
jgi:ArsR family transcriptional regulator, arsenate/arsenite/antimonite-responsive transcriptional repressor